MSGKDILTLLLVSFGFKKIKIQTYRGANNALGYKIYATNEETGEYYQDENCEGLMFNIAYIINEMRDRNIEAKYWILDGGEYSTKEILKMFKK